MLCLICIMVCLIFSVSHLFAQKEVLAFIPVFEKSFKFLESGRKRRSIILLFQLFLHLRKTNCRSSMKLNSGKLEKVSPRDCTRSKTERYMLKLPVYGSTGNGTTPHGGEGKLPIMAYTGRLRPKGVLFSGFRFMKEEGFH